MSNQLLSDYNAPYGERNSNVSRYAIYSDLDLAFMVHPIVKDIIPITDIAAVKNAVKNLVLTSLFERPFKPALGSRIKRLLFEPADFFTAIALKEEIYELINANEPRISQVEVNVKDMSDDNAYAITVGFNVLYDNREETTFYLNRIR